jgi:hypothetical protein
MVGITLMKHYRDANNIVYAFEGNGSQDYLIKPDMVLLGDAELLSFINPPPTTAQLAAQAEADAIKALRVETKANAAFDALKSADFSAINTFVNLHFGTTDVQGRAMLKVMAAAAGAYLRENKG